MNGISEKFPKEIPFVKIELNVAHGFVFRLSFPWPPKLKITSKSALIVGGLDDHAVIGGLYRVILANCLGAELTKDLFKIG